MSLRVDLLTPCLWPEVSRDAERFPRELAEGLLSLSHRPRLITSHPGRLARSVDGGVPVLRLPRPPDARLRRRLVEDHVTHIPLSYAALRLGDADVVHALAAPDALAAVRWKRHSGKPAVLSLAGIPDHDWLMARRKRLDIVLAALRGCDAVVVPDQGAADGFESWLGHTPRVIEPDDGCAGRYLALYEDLLRGPGKMADQ
jgi:hypothetical protein